jgi:hypothetical protein
VKPRELDEGEKEMLAAFASLLGRHGLGSRFPDLAHMVEREKGRLRQVREMSAALTDEQASLLRTVGGRTLVTPPHDATLFHAVGAPAFLADAARLPLVEEMVALGILEWMGDLHSRESRAQVTEFGHGVQTAIETSQMSVAA